jgi:hypothetical protein
MVTCNATGDEKLPLVFVHKYETPRPLRGIENPRFLSGIIGIKKGGCREVSLIIFCNDLMNR